MRAIISCSALTIRSPQCDSDCLAEGKVRAVHVPLPPCDAVNTQVFRLVVSAECIDTAVYIYIFWQFKTSFGSCYI